jgi:hypothetical protein
MTPIRFTSMRRAWDSSGMDSNGPQRLIPALLIQRSIRPKVAAAPWASSRIPSASATSVGMANARPSSASHSCAAHSSGAWRRTASTRLAPRRAKASAVANPMPLDPPVTTTVTLYRLPMTISLPSRLFAGAVNPRNASSSSPYDGSRQFTCHNAANTLGASSR